MGDCHSCSAAVVLTQVLRQLSMRMASQRCGLLWSSKVRALACGVPASLLVNTQLSRPQMPRSVSCGAGRKQGPAKPHCPGPQTAQTPQAICGSGLHERPAI